MSDRWSRGGSPDDLPTSDIDAIPSACDAPAVQPQRAGKPIGVTPWQAPVAPPLRHGVLTDAARDDKAALAKQICDVMRLMYEQEVVVANDGNVSCRLPNGNILITASGILKGFMTPDEIIECDPEGNSLDGRRVTSEIKMHVAAYQVRPDIRAVVHGHPIFAVAFSLAGLSLAECNIPEIIVTMGAIPTAPYATPGTYDLPAVLAGHLANGDAVIMERHGVVTVGSDIFDAFKKMEMVEHTAKIMHAAQTLGGQVKPLNQQEVQELLDSRKALGITTTNTMCWKCGADQECEAPDD
ncbi:MAG: class II aldolase/adducin family protein [Planctomycetota bacterium]|nr:MAG: class II aldolase/adducin family protein [Planctomycetota bacterium]